MALHERALDANSHEPAKLTATRPLSIIDGVSADRREGRGTAIALCFVAATSRVRVDASCRRARKGLVSPEAAAEGRRNSRRSKPWAVAAPAAADSFALRGGGGGGASRAGRRGPTRAARA